jgi:hypothetical protein
VNLEGYVDVSTRLRLALELHPELRVQCSQPQVIALGDHVYLQVTTTVWRTPDDPLPAIATAWEPWPGRTSFTKDSEAMNAETSSLGRALGLLGVGIARSIASSDEVRVRKQTPPADRAPIDDDEGPTGTRHASQAQLELIRKLAAERGVPAQLEGLTVAQASEQIKTLKAMGVPR